MEQHVTKRSIPRCSLRRMMIGLCAVLTACAGVESGDDGPNSAAEISQALETNVVARVTGEKDLTTITVTDSQVPQGTVTGKLIEGDTTYLFVENSNDNYMPNVRHASPGRLIQEGSPCLGGHGNCLLFNAYGTPTDFTFSEKTGWSNDRLELVLSRGDLQALTFGQNTYLRFYIRLDTSFETPASEFIVSQVWQNSSSLGPVFAIYIIQDPQDPTQLGMSFRYRNDPNAPQQAEYAHEFHYERIARGTWYNYHLMLKPSYVGMASGRGAILIWKDVGLNGSLIDTQAVNYSATDDTRYKFYWGFPPGGSLGSTFDIRLGIYRGMPSKHAPVWFDSIKVTRSTAAMPGI